MSRNQTLRVIPRQAHHDVDFETSFRIRIFASCVDLALNQIFIQGRRNVQRNGKSYLRRKSDFFSTRLHT